MSSMTLFGIYCLCAAPLFLCVFINQHRKTADILRSDLFAMIIVSFIPILRELILISFIPTVVIKRKHDGNIN
jgi:hypothetical protein